MERNGPLPSGLILEKKALGLDLERKTEDKEPIVLDRFPRIQTSFVRSIEKKDQEIDSPAQLQQNLLQEFLATHMMTGDPAVHRKLIELGADTLPSIEFNTKFNEFIKESYEKEGDIEFSNLIWDVGRGVLEHKINLEEVFKLLDDVAEASKRGEKSHIGIELHNLTQSGLLILDQISKNPSFQNLYSQEVLKELQQATVSLRETLVQNGELGVKYGLDMPPPRSALELTKLLMDPSEQSAELALLGLLSQSAKYLDLENLSELEKIKAQFNKTANSVNPEFLRAFLYFYQQPGNRKVFTEVLKRYTTLAGKLDEFEVALKNKDIKTMRKLSTEDIVQKVKDPEASLSERTLAILALRNDENLSALLELYKSEQNAVVKEILGSALVFVCQENPEKKFNKVLEILNIDPSLSKKLMEKLKYVFGQTSLHEAVHHDRYAFLQILANNPYLLKEFLNNEENPLESIPLLRKISHRRSRAVEYGRVYANLLQSENPSPNDIYQFAIHFQTPAPEFWSQYLRISKIEQLYKESDANLSEEEKIERGQEVLRELVERVMGDSKNADKKQQADKRNRRLLSELQSSIKDPLEPGTLLHGTNIEYLSTLLNRGLTAGEFLGVDQSDDATLFDLDLGVILDGDEKITMMTRARLQNQGTKPEETIKELEDASDFTRKYYQSIPAGYGARPRIRRGIAIDAKNRLGSGITLLFDRSSSEAFSKGLEHPGPMDINRHVLLPVGLPCTEISGIVIDGKFQGNLREVKQQVVKNGFFIPIYDVDGTLLFSIEEYDQLLSG